MNVVLLTGAAIFKDDKILLLKRTDNKKILPGYWDIPGGKLEEFEDPNISVIRELKEETDLKGKIIAPYNVWSTELIFKNTKEYIIEIDYIVDAGKIDDKKIMLSPSEHCEFSWVSKNELPKKLTPELRATILKAFKARR